MFARNALLTALAMLAFAGNSLLCRMALKLTTIDAASFTIVRLVSGALVLWVLVRLRGQRRNAADGGAGRGFADHALFLSTRFSGGLGGIALW